MDNKMIGYLTLGIGKLWQHGDMAAWGLDGVVFDPPL